MARIQWTPLAVDDVSSSAIRAQQMAGQTFQNAFSGLNGVLNQWEGSQRDREMGELLQRQESFVGKDSALYDAARARGELTQGFRYIKPEALASAVRSFGTELERDYRGDLAFADGRVDRAFTLDERARQATERNVGVEVARERERIRAAVANKEMTVEQGVAATNALAAKAVTAEQITGSYSAVRDGTQDYRNNVRWDRDGVTWADGREDRALTLEQRANEKAATALAQQYVNFEGTTQDLMRDERYAGSSPEVQGMALEMLGRRSPTAFAGPAPAGGDDSGGGGLTGDYDRMLVALESGGNANAQPRLKDGSLASSATGLHQFTEQTWLNTVKAAGFDWARGKSNQELLAMRRDPAKSSQAELHLRNANIASLRAAGIPVNNANVYAMHHFSPVQAQRFARSGDGTPAERIFSQATLDSNPYLKGKTKAEILANWDRRSGGIARVAGQSGEIVVGSTVASASDRFGRSARNIATGLRDDTDDGQVIDTMLASGDFGGVSRARAGSLLREVQEKYEDEVGGVLPPAAALQILLEATKTYNARRDFFGNLTGQSSAVYGEGAFGGARSTVNWNTVGSLIRQFNPDPKTGEVPLAINARRQENRDSDIATAQALREQITALEADVARRVRQDSERRIFNNPVTTQKQADLARLLERWDAFAPTASGRIAASGR